MHEQLEADTDWDDPDDVLAGRMADAMLELARHPGIHRLAAMQAAGLAADKPTHEDIGRAFALSRRQVRCLELRALADIRRRHPELRHDLRELVAVNSQFESNPRTFSGDNSRDD